MKKYWGNRFRKETSRSHRGVASLLVLLGWCGTASALADGDCAAIFPGVVQSHHASGKVDFRFASKVEGNSSTTIIAPAINTSLFNTHCAGSKCYASNSTSAKIGITQFFHSSSMENVELGLGESRSIGDSWRNEFNNIVTDADATLHFSSNQSEYAIKRLELGYNSQTYLAPGDYWIDELVIHSYADLNIAAGGPVRIYVSGNVTIYNNANINPGQQNAKNLMLFVSGNVVAGGYVEYNGLLYSNGNTEVGFGSTFAGAVAGATVKLTDYSKIIFRSDAVDATAFSILCSAGAAVNDMDGDSIPDEIDSDRDGDGINNNYEAIAGTDPNDSLSVPVDANDNGVPDSLEVISGANQCESAFAAGIQSYVSGSVAQFKYDAALSGVDSPYLPYGGITRLLSLGRKSCGDFDCIASGLVANSLNAGVFKTTTSSVDFTVGFNGTGNLDGTASAEFKKINVLDFGELTISNVSELRADTLYLGWESKLNLVPGDYWINNLSVGAFARIKVQGEGTVRLYVGNGTVLEWGSQINVNTNTPGTNTQKLLIYGYGNVYLAAHADMEGIVFSGGNVTLDGYNRMYGAVMSQNIVLGDDVILQFEKERAKQVDYGRVCDIDNDGIYDGRDPDQDGDGINDEYELVVGTDPRDAADVPPDLDHDGLPDSLDDDRDGDGLLNDADLFPDDPLEWSDIDSDGIGDNADTDRDGDTILNDHEVQLGFDPNDPASVPPDMDGDTLPDALDDDRDGDSVLNDHDLFPDDASEWSDIDGDGIGDNGDPDRDGDGIANDYETQLGFDPADPASTPPDMDGDGKPNALDEDRDGDGYNNDTDRFPDNKFEWSDLDNDGVGDNSDPDRDGDGISNDYETQLGFDPNNPASKPVDQDGDGLPDALDNDRDGDGRNNDEDRFPDDASEWADMDNDGIGDNSDPDRDGDGISNEYEQQLGTDPGNPASVPADMDGDGIPDSLDDDRDGDGYNNTSDLFPDNGAEWTDLDGDGEGDNADADRDGDGFSNTEEEAWGSDPNDPADFPDGEPPQINFDIAGQQTTQSDTIQLTGSVTDDKSGVASLIAISDRMPGIEFTPVINGQFWLVDVPLEMGGNVITFVALDGAGNRAEKSVTVDRQQANVVVDLLIDSPAQNTVLETSSIVVRGRLISEAQIKTLTLTVAGVTTPVTATASAVEWQFVSGDVSLQPGVNQINVEALVNGVQFRRVLRVSYQDPQQTLEAPEFVSVAPAAGRYINGQNFKVSGEISAPAGIKSLTLNGEPVGVQQGNTTVLFAKDVTMPIDASEFAFTLQATDMLDRGTQLQRTIYRDIASPVVQLNNSIAPMPVENLVNETPYTLSGKVTDINLAAMTLNGQAVQLSAGSGVGEYLFSLPVAVAANTLNIARLEAFDFAGNSSVVDYGLRLEFDVGLDFLRPIDGAQLEHSNAPLAVLVAARATNAPAGYRADVTVTSAVADVINRNLTVEGALISGEVTLPPLAGDYRFNVAIYDQSNTLLAQSARMIKVKVAEPVVLAVEKTIPAAGSQNVEPNSFISVFFNTAVDPAKVQLHVHETAHGLTYLDSDQAGTDAIRAKGFTLQEVHRDYQAVPGVTTMLPENKGIAFYPETNLAYDGEVFVEVIYDGQSLARLNYNTRPLPTFVEGGVLDQLGQPVAGIEVVIPKLNRIARTNAEGYFTFGYQDRAEDTMPSGRYQVIVNDGLKDTRYGNLVRWVSVQRGVRNYIGRQTLPVLNQEIAFSYIKSETEAVINGGELNLNLSNASVQFSNSRTDGAVHVQFMPLSRLQVEVMPELAPMWTYSVQPSGVQVTGDLQFSFAIPAYQGSYEYAPQENELVVLLGVDVNANRLVPVGVGKSENQRIFSQGKTHYQVMDQFAYFRVTPMQQQTLQDYLDDKISLPQLISSLQNFELTLPEQN